MKLKDFLTLKVGSGILLGSSRYNPYINYTWSNTFQVANKMYYKNIGNSGQNLQLFSGQGVKFNGTNQSIPINNIALTGNFSFSCRKEWDGGSFDIIISDDASKYIGIANSTNIVVKGDIYYYINTIIPLVSQKTYDITVVRDGSILYGYIDGVLQGSIAISSFNMNASNIGKYLTNYSQGITTDVYMFTDALTQQEIELYTNNPNKFFQDTRDGVIDNCVLNMPLHGVDRFQVDYSRYAIYPLLVLDFKTEPIFGTFTSFNSTVVSYDSSLSRGVITGTTTNTAFSNTIPIVSGKKVYIEIDILESTGREWFTYNGSTYISIGTTVANVITKLKAVVSCTGNYVISPVRAIGITTAYIYNFSITELSGINEVINYTADCVTGAKQLPYGSQEANFFHKSSGVPIRTGLSPFFESTPYWGNYGNTGWIPETNQEFILEAIIQNAKEGGVILYEGLGIETNNAANFWIRQLKTTGIINLTIGTSAIDSIYVNKNFYYVSAQVKTTGVSFYINGILIGTAIYNYNRSLNTLNRTFTVGGVNRGVIEKASTKEVRHFKVITDAKTISTYNALTEYNKLAAKGLLANFVLDENGDYMQDEFGNYIMDI